jgi:hypothetical protein
MQLLKRFGKYFVILRAIVTFNLNNCDEWRPGKVGII